MIDALFRVQQGRNKEHERDDCAVPKIPAIAAGIIKDGERSGFHSLRHSLSTWVNRTLKDVKIAQTLLRHSKPDITAGIYIHGVPEENLKAQEQYMAALQKPASDAIQ